MKFHGETHDDSGSSRKMAYVVLKALEGGAEPDMKRPTRQAGMVMRYLWTLERDGGEPRGGLDTVDALVERLEREGLPGVMPPDWIVATLQMDEDNEGVAVHSSPLGWQIRVKRMA
jgi:hypothetical protein